jgi:hypothetical protein
MRDKFVVVAASVVALLVVCAGGARAAGSLSVRVLSDRANLVSGGEVLSTVNLPRGVSPAFSRAATC